MELVAHSGTIYLTDDTLSDDFIKPEQFVTPEKIADWQREGYYAVQIRHHVTGEGIESASEHDILSNLAACYRKMYAQNHDAVLTDWDVHLYKTGT
jgi:hypothetical protein